MNSVNQLIALWVCDAMVAVMIPVNIDTTSDKADGMNLSRTHRFIPSVRIWLERKPWRPTITLPSCSRVMVVAISSSGYGGIANDPEHVRGLQWRGGM